MTFACCGRPAAVRNQSPRSLLASNLPMILWRSLSCCADPDDSLVSAVSIVRLSRLCSPAPPSLACAISRDKTEPSNNETVTLLFARLRAKTKRPRQSLPSARKGNYCSLLSDFKLRRALGKYFGKQADAASKDDKRSLGAHKKSRKGQKKNVERRLLERPRVSVAYHKISTR